MHSRHPKRAYTVCTSMGVGKGGQGGPRSLLDIEILSIKSCFLYFEWDNNKFHHFWPPGKILEKSPSGPPGKKSLRRPCAQQGRIQPVRVEGAISVTVGNQAHNSFATVREVKCASQHCCDKTVDDRMAL